MSYASCPNCKEKYVFMKQYDWSYHLQGVKITVGYDMTFQCRDCLWGMCWPCTEEGVLLPQSQEDKILQRASN